MKSPRPPQPVHVPTQNPPTPAVTATHTLVSGVQKLYADIFEEWVPFSRVKPQGPGEPLGRCPLLGRRLRAPAGTGVPALPLAGPRAPRGPTSGALAELKMSPDPGARAPARYTCRVPRVPGLPGAPGESGLWLPGRAGEEPVHQQWGGEPGALTQVTSGLCRKSSMSSETVRSMLRLRPPAPRPASPSPAPRHKAAPAASGGRGAPAARARETKAGREPTFRGFGGPAPRPGLGEGEGPPLGEEQCGRRPRPSAALGGRRAASRSRGRETRRGLGWAARGVGRGRSVPHVRGGGAPCDGSWLPARGFAAARLRRALGAPARGASLRACVRREAPAPSTDYRAPALAAREGARRTLTPRLPALDRCSPSAARGYGPGCRRGAPPAQMAGDPSPHASRAGVGLAGKWSGQVERRPVERRPGDRRRKLWEEFRPSERDRLRPSVPPPGCLPSRSTCSKPVMWPLGPGPAPTITSLPPPSTLPPLFRKGAKFQMPTWGT